MAKKKLLNEAQVRRFMSLSGIQPLKEMGGYKMEEDEMEEGVYEEEEADLPAEAPEMDDMEAEEAPEMDAAPEAAESTVEIEQEDVDVLADLSEKLPGIVAKLQGEEAPAMDDMEAEEAPEAPEVDDMDAEGELEPDEEEPAVMEDLSGVNLTLTQEEMVQEVTRRVAKRIMKAKRAQEQLDEALGNKRSKAK